MDHTFAIGIDLGGTNTDIGLVRDDGHIVNRCNLPTNRYTELQPFVDDIMQAIRSLMAGVTPRITGIGIGAPNGNFYTGCVDNAPNLTIKGVLNFEAAMRRHMSVPVVLSNDANAAAFGELVYGAARDLKHFIMFTLGTGVGSGIVVDGKLVHGATGAAGELGHNILIPDGRLCSCGRRGCLEAYTSARGIVQSFCELRATHAGADDDVRRLHSDWIQPSVPDEAVSSKMVGDAANAGDPLALRTYQQTARYLGIAMANAVTFSAPEAIFLMGGPAKVGRPLLEPLQREFEAHLLYIYKGCCTIRLSQLPANDAAILGAAALIKMKS